MEINLYEISAILGSLLFLTSFAYINRKANAENDIVYMLMNIFAASFMLISLLEFWNIGVLINNIAWILIGTYSLYKHRLPVKQACRNKI